ncbi:hypothetical protein QZM43_32675 [Burkholderia orbicola]|uniref:hypothetical protein n=1 Tax=Burkholderia cepacia complex TaxID=87882 RepID=UPI0019082068|nr:MULTISPECIES: hypothetical protein [Burkholderia cepacia complex]MBJ9594106.1 hypothetical protein [Burkholderia seminalis]MDN7472538.1 hypothetical protein [Burkholderia orbicola]MDN7507500.1 hypothetical protein [Burkholderia orbicola]
MSEQKIKWRNLHPVLCAPPTQADLDAERRRALIMWFGGWAAFVATELAIFLLVEWPSFLGATLMCVAFAFAALVWGGSSPFSTKAPWSPVTAADLPVLKEVFTRDPLDAEAVERYRREVAALGRPLARRDLLVIDAHREAVRAWIAQEANARELAAFSEPGQMSREAGGEQ